MKKGRVRMIVKGELKEFTKPNTVRGTESKESVLARFGLKELTKAKPKYIKQDGEVYKMVDGNLIKLFKKS